MLKLKIELVHPNAKIPIKATPTAACWDVFAADIKREADDFYIVDLGFKLQPPPGYKVILVPRSSITKTYLIQQNSPGQGDEDFRGIYQYRFRCIPNSISDLPKEQWGIPIPNFTTGITTDPFPITKLDYILFPYNVGDRIGQIYLEKVIDFEFEEGKVDDSIRGEGAFGSTGK